MSRSAATAAALAAAALLLAPTVRAQAAFQGLGDLPGSAFSSAAHGVSADGNVVVGASTSVLGNEAFRWSQPGGIQAIGGGPSSEAVGASASGTVIVGTFVNASVIEAFRWTQAGGIQGLGTFPGDAAYSKGFGISADASVLVGEAGINPEAFRWTQADGMQRIDGGPGSTAFGVSSDGSVIVGSYFGATGTEAFRWTSSGGRQGLGTLPGSPTSQAFGVSADGSVVVGQSGGRAFRWSQATGMVGLGDFPNGFTNSARGASADGSVIVGQGFAPGLVAIVWTAADGARSLRDVLIAQGVDMTGWTLQVAQGVSADGRTVVGFGTNPQGQSEAFRAVLSGGHRWIDPTGGSWDVAVNWEPATVPGLSDNVRFDIPGTYTVFGSPAAGPRTVLGLHASDGTVDYELDNLNLISISLTAPSLAVSGGATAKVISGSTTIVDAVVGFEDNAAGDTTTIARLQVFNTGTTLASSGLLMVGGGTGTARGDLFVAAGGLETAAAVIGGASIGEAVVGNGGEWTVNDLLTVGLIATGRLTVENGGRVIAGSMLINEGATGDTEDGRVFVSGSSGITQSELFVSDTLTVASGGLGVLGVSSGGIITAGHLAIGPADHTALVLVSGIELASGFTSQLIANSIAVGDRMEVFDGALAQSNALRVGRTGVSALLRVGGGTDGSGVLLVQGECRVDGAASGTPSTFSITDGGEAFCLSATLREGARVDIDTPFSTLTVRGVTSVDNGTVQMTFGTLDGIDLKGVTTPDPVDVAVLTQGEIAGAGIIIGTLVAGGLVSPGIVTIDPPSSGPRGGRGTVGGALVVRGRVELQPAATLQVGLAGPDTTQQGRLRVRPVAGVATLDGSATLGGTLRLAFSDGYAPQTGDTFLLLDAASATGAFATTEVTGLEPGWQFEIVVANGAVVLNSQSNGVPTTPAEPGAPAPAGLVLHAPAPNPAAGSTTLRYELPAAGRVRLALYDALGREVAVVVDGDRAAGAHEVTLRVGALAPGVFVARLQGGSAEGSVRLTVVR